MCIYIYIHYVYILDIYTMCVYIYTHTVLDIYIYIYTHYVYIYIYIYTHVSLSRYIYIERERDIPRSARGWMASPGPPAPHAASMATLLLGTVFPRREYMKSSFVFVKSLSHGSIHYSTYPER